MTAIVAVAAVGATLLAASGPGGAQAPPAKPNVIVIEADDMSSDELRFMPNVQNLLVKEGTSFANSFVSYSLCCPSRSTFETGQYAHNHGVFDNKPPQGGYYKLPKGNLLPVWLQRVGYFTAEVGKQPNGYGTQNPTEVPPGWNDWHALVDPSTYSYYGYTLNDNGALAKVGSASADYQTDVLGGRVQSILAARAAQDQPFFLWYTPLANHAGGPKEAGDPAGQATPAPAPRHKGRFAALALPRPASFNEADVSDKPAAVRNRKRLTATQIAGITANYRQRAETLLALDDSVGQIVSSLQSAGKLDNTVIVFTSDNGFMHGEHRIRNGKIVSYEPSIRVPLVIRGPGFPKGSTNVEPVANVDLAPTVVAAAGAQPGLAMDGRSLQRVAADPTYHLGRSILLETPSYSGVRTGRFKWVEYTNGDRELYDLAADPNELTNLRTDPRYAGLGVDLAGQLARLKGCRGNSCRAKPRIQASARCSHGSLSIRVGGSGAHLIDYVDFFLDGRRIGRDRHARFGERTRRSGTTARANAVLEDGRSVSLDERAPRC